jgi:uncharacterized protein
MIVFKCILFVFCFVFSPLYDPLVPPTLNHTSETYKSATSTPSINHFYEKLLTLKSLMKTNSGRKRAEKRHLLMEQFLNQFDEEIAGRA